MDQREFAMRWFLKECALKYNDPSINLTPFETDDRGNKNGSILKYAMCYDRRNPALEKFAGPDSYFYHCPPVNIRSFEETRDQIIAAGDMAPTINKVGWFGNIYSPIFSDVPEHKTRPLMKKIGDENSELFDIIQVDPKDGQLNENIKTYLTLPEQMRYRFLIDIGGNSWSCRLKLLLFSKRPLLLVDRYYIDYYHNDLKPYVHYVPVNMDLSDLVEKTRWMMEHYEECLGMAQAAFDYAVTNFTKDKLLERVHYVATNIKNEKAARIQYYKNSIQMAFENADKSVSKLTPDHSNEKHFINNLCFISPRYLELGTWESSIVSRGMYQNTGSFICINTPPRYEITVREFFETVETSKGANNPLFHQGDYYQVHAASLPKSNLLVYSGVHTLKSTYTILKHYAVAMDDIFIVVLNDWNCYHTRDAFTAATKELSLRTVYDQVNQTWKTGIYVAVLERF